MKKFIAILVFGLLIPFAAAADDAPCTPPPPPPNPLWSGQADLSYLATSGNSQGSSFGADLDVVYLPAPWKVELKSAFLRNEQGNDETARRLSASLRGERSMTERFSIFAQGSYLRDIFAGIDGQKIVQAGGLYKILNGPAHFLSGQLGVGYTWESLVPPDPDRNFAVATAGLLYKWKLSATAEFNEEADYIRDLKTSADWRFNNTASVTAAVSNAFALKIGHQLTYVNLPPAGKAKTDTAVTAAIVVKFAK